MTATQPSHSDLKRSSGGIIPRPRSWRVATKTSVYFVSSCTFARRLDALLPPAGFFTGRDAGGVGRRVSSPPSSAQLLAPGTANSTLPLSLLEFVAADGGGVVVDPTGTTFAGKNLVNWSAKILPTNARTLGGAGEERVWGFCSHHRRHTERAKRIWTFVRGRNSAAHASTISLGCAHQARTSNATHTLRLPIHGAHSDAGSSCASCAVDDVVWPKWENASSLSMFTANEADPVYACSLCAGARVRSSQTYQ